MTSGCTSTTSLVLPACWASLQPVKHWPTIGRTRWFARRSRRQFEIIGEALSQACRVDPRLPDRVSHCRQIIAFRNRLIHGYATVADEVVWDIVEGYLPTLVREVTGLLGKEAEQP